AVDGLRPGLGVRPGVAGHHRGERLVEQGQVDLGEVDELELGVVALARQIEDPAADVTALAGDAPDVPVAAWTGAAHNDGDLDRHSDSSRVVFGRDDATRVIRDFQ